MRYLKNILPLLLFAVVMVMQSCGKKEKIISQDTFAQIVSEMYLADQFVDQNPPYRAQTDTAALYDAIFKKYGYARSDYQTTVQYYLQKGKAYKEIHQKARKILSVREAELRKMIEIQSGVISGWWAVDTARTIPVEKLEQEPFLRAIKWMLIKEVKTDWKFGDPVIKDIPYNIYWWKNNIRLAGVDSTCQKQGVLLKDYLQKEGAFQKKNTPGEKPVPDTEPQSLISKDTLLREALPGKRLQDSLKQAPDLSNPKKLHIR